MFFKSVIKIGTERLVFCNPPAMTVELTVDFWRFLALMRKLLIIKFCSLTTIESCAKVIAFVISYFNGNCINSSKMRHKIPAPDALFPSISLPHLKNAKNIKMKFYYAHPLQLCEILMSFNWKLFHLRRFLDDICETFHLRKSSLGRKIVFGQK